ncbi:beta-glucuronidase [Pedobacter sp. MC2016-14]|uniref:glycoside hydrolase family 2 protein n=1 Tax=Pedobacter sp. MC2016-14 TaxID=2897327 RepID=UPI001E4BAF03|nr:glycoside hydrolase family 2 TIM barrel-domain containing protein [Pedobacter sp. MC2016-14]MCD0488825.1 beta-glucuronidase [Pedobacter sp. MC2016-14]
MLTCLLIALSTYLNAEVPLITNVSARNITSLNGKWNYIIDPLDNGFFDYRLEPLKNGFFKNQKPTNPSQLIEYNFDTSPYMKIPADWNTQDNQLFFYEGSVWFKKDFTHQKKANNKTYIYFAAVNYRASVYINGQLAGHHIGGYTPFNFDITDLLLEGKNFVVLRVNNNRGKDEVPTVNMDWWNYGGITREVMLVEVPQVFIEDYQIQLAKNNKGLISGWLKLNAAKAGEAIVVEIPELKIKQELKTDQNGLANFEIKAKPALWSPKNPKIYEIILSKADERITDQIAFRTIETKGKDILLNGEKIFLSGISIHEEAPYRQGRAWSKDDARTLLGWAKEMGCNFVRLAHYPHNENMVREAEKMGLMVWSEIPVYWTISWLNEGTYNNAKKQLHDMVYRDKNRAAVVIWSIANETPHGEARDKFLSNLATYARSLDNTRLLSMAMEVNHLPNHVNVVEDNMNKYVDIISFNEYMGWYDGRGTSEDCRVATWKIPYNKPIVVSEFGGDALQGLYGDKTERWTEDFQEELYIRNLEMLSKIDGLSGVSPWILKDFHSPRRQLFGIQDWFNRKGLISDQGIKKKAFYIMQNWYKTKNN